MKAIENIRLYLLTGSIWIWPATYFGEGAFRLPVLAGKLTNSRSNGMFGDRQE